jgi:hypothetical protein
MPTRAKGAQRAGRKAHNRGGVGGTRAREHEGTGTRGHVGFFVPAEPASPVHPMQSATIIRGSAGRAPRARTGRAVAIGPRRRATPPTTDRALSDAQGRYDAERRHDRF